MHPPKMNLYDRYTSLKDPLNQVTWNSFPFLAPFPDRCRRSGDRRWSKPIPVFSIAPSGTQGYSVLHVEWESETDVALSKAKRVLGSVFLWNDCTDKRPLCPILWFGKKPQVDFACAQCAPLMVVTWRVFRIPRYAKMQKNQRSLWPEATTQKPRYLWIGQEWKWDANETEWNWNKLVSFDLVLGISMN